MRLLLAALLMWAPSITAKTVCDPCGRMGCIVNHCYDDETGPDLELKFGDDGIILPDWGFADPPPGWGYGEPEPTCEWGYSLTKDHAGTDVYISSETKDAGVCSDGLVHWREVQEKP